MGSEPLWTGYRFRAVDADGWTTFWRLDPREQPFELHDWTRATGSAGAPAVVARRDAGRSTGLVGRRRPRR